MTAVIVCISVHFSQALEQDQKASLEKMIHNCPGLEHIRASTYDGDTPQEQRPSWYRTPFPPNETLNLIQSYENSPQSSLRIL
jgi:hypothetical protein